MRDFDPVTANYLATRPAGLVAHLLLWVSARDRITGLIEAIGFWDGPDDQAFVVDGVTRPYFGAGTVLGLAGLTYGAGGDVQIGSVILSGISPEVEQAIYGYDARLAPIELHRLIRDSETNAFQGPPHRILSGLIDGLKPTTPEDGGQGSVTVSIASSLRKLTRPETLKRGDESHRRRQDDRFRRYADISGVFRPNWGQK